MSGYTFDLRDLARRARQYDDERALADNLAAFIDKPVRAYIAIPNTGADADTYTVRFDEAWKAERDAVLARWREAR